MKKGWIIIALAGALALSAFVPAIAQRPGGWLQKRHAGFMVQHIAHDLNLSASQRAQIKAILQNEQPRIQELLKKSQQANEQLRSKASFDGTFVRSIAQQQGSNAADAIVEREWIRAQIMAVLSPDQQQKLDRLTSEFRAAIGSRLATLGDEL